MKKPGIRQQVLADFLNEPDIVKLALGLYSWRGISYEVLPYSLTIKRHNWSGFIRYMYKGNVYCIREATNDMIKKYYKNI